MAEASETLEHPVLGSLRWEPDCSQWETSFRLPSGTEIDVFITPEDADDRYAFLERAAELFRWALDNERYILSDAIRAELLELYNGTWRQGDEPELTADELTARLDWQLLVINNIDIVPVEFSYGAGDLFGYHGVTIDVDAELRFCDIELRG